MSKCEVCGAKEGVPVRLPAGDTVPRRLFQCPECKTIICNGCMRHEAEHGGKGQTSERSRNPIRLLAGLKFGGQASTAVVQARCSICNAAMDLEANVT